MHVCEEVYICMHVYVRIIRQINSWNNTVRLVYVGPPAIYIGCNSFTYLFFTVCCRTCGLSASSHAVWMVASLIKIQACGV